MRLERYDDNVMMMGMAMITSFWYFEFGKCVGGKGVGEDGVKWAGSTVGILFAKKILSYTPLDACFCWSNLVMKCCKLG